VFLDFAKALMNDLSYLMEDSMDRIADVQAISAIKSDASKWSALPAHEKRTKESFLQSQVRIHTHRHTCMYFLRACEVCFV
jgi:hypothetical protein